MCVDSSHVTSGRNWINNIKQYDLSPCSYKQTGGTMYCDTHEHRVKWWQFQWIFTNFINFERFGQQWFEPQGKRPHSPPIYTNDCRKEWWVTDKKMEIPES